MKLLNFFRRFRKWKVGIIFKSGKELIIYCDKFTWKTTANKMTSYNLDGVIPPVPNHIRMEEVVAIVTYDSWFGAMPSCKEETEK